MQSSGCGNNRYGGGGSVGGNGNAGQGNVGGGSQQSGTGNGAGGGGGSGGHGSVWRDSIRTRDANDLGGAGTNINITGFDETYACGGGGLDAWNNTPHNYPYREDAYGNGGDGGKRTGKSGISGVVIVRFKLENFVDISKPTSSV